MLCYIFCLNKIDFDVKKIAPITSQAVNSTNWGTPTFTATVSTSSQRLATSTPSITVPASLPIDTKGSVGRFSMWQIKKLEIITCFMLKRKHFY